MNEQSPYRLIIHKPEGDEFFLLPIGTTTLGRESSRELVLMHPLVSRLHAQILCTQDTCEITDLESANGTVLNDLLLAPKTPYALKSQDCIHIGPFDIILEIIAQKAEVDLGAEAPPGELKPAGIPGLSSLKESIQEPLAPHVELSSKEGIPYSQPPDEIPPSLPPFNGKADAEDEQVFMMEGASIYSTRLINYLPDIYRNSTADRFMERFLGLFESIWLPIEYTVDNFDIYLDPRTAPKEFLPWLAQWFDMSIDISSNEQQLRTFLHEAHTIFACRGTKKALIRVLEIFTGYSPEIIEFGENLAPHTFKVRFNLPKSELNQHTVERLVDANKPAHTSYLLEFSR